MSKEVALRDLVYADQTLAELSSIFSQKEAAPHAALVRGVQYLDKGDRAAAREEFRQIVRSEQVPSRVVLWAASALREMGERPRRKGAKVLGTVLEVGVRGGTDVLAAYEDQTARFLPNKGSVFVLDSFHKELTALVTQLIIQSQEAMNEATLIPHHRTQPPNSARFTFLTAEGLRALDVELPSLRPATPIGRLFEIAVVLLREIVTAVQRQDYPER